MCNKQRIAPITLRIMGIGSPLLHWSHPGVGWARIFFQMSTECSRPASLVWIFYTQSSTLTTTSKNLSKKHEIIEFHFFKMATSIQQNFYLSTAPFFQAENCWPNSVKIAWNNWIPFLQNDNFGSTEFLFKYGSVFSGWKLLTQFCQNSMK
jgi:hypothetical protein